jgi:hypothetical protein
METTKTAAPRAASTTKYKIVLKQKLWLSCLAVMFAVLVKAQPVGPPDISNYIGPNAPQCSPAAICMEFLPLSGQKVVSYYSPNFTKWKNRTNATV